MAWRGFVFTTWPGTASKAFSSTGHTCIREKRHGTRHLTVSSDTGQKSLVANACQDRRLLHPLRILSEKILKPTDGACQDNVIQSLRWYKETIVKTDERPGRGSANPPYICP